MAKFLVLCLKKVVHNLTWFAREPCGIAIELLPLFKKAGVDVMGEVSKGALWEEKGRAVPHSFKKNEEFCHGGDGHRGLGAEGTQLCGADLDLELAISLGAVESV